MLYSFFRFILRITNKVYFNKFQVKGLDNIPDTGPLFLVANHPSAFMDPIVIATVTNRKLSFLGKGILFDNKILKWLLPKFNVIPIFRINETAGQANKNKDIFTLCYKHFANGGALLAFPEGISLTERKIKKIQSGTARICLGAAAANNYELDIKIVVIGLNFSDPHKFQSDLFIKIDAPINVSDYYDLHKADSFKAAHSLSDEIRLRLETQVVAIENADIDKLVANIELMYKSQILQDLGHSSKLMEHHFNTSKAISDSVHYFSKTDPSRVEDFKSKIKLYLSNLEHLSLNDNLIKRIGKSAPILNAFKSILFIICGFPFFIFGILNNFLPFKIPGWSAKYISDRAEFYGSIAFSLGTLTFILFYSAQLFLFFKYVNDFKLLLLYCLLLPTSGIFAFIYYKRIKIIKGNWKILLLFYKRTNIITSLISTRQIIIDDLDKARKEFIEQRDGFTANQL
jgi:1-acyl-sn-glycerol-3-phosphate acyltransferase